MTLLACQGDPPTTLPDATLEVTTVTTGEAGPDGYTIQLDDEAPLAIGTDATRQFSGLAPGEHQVLLEGLIAPCTATGENPRTVTVTAGETTAIEFQVVCSAGGSLSITIQTTGESRDPNGYLLSIGTDQARRVESEATTLIGNMAPGSYDVALADVAPNCSIAEGETRKVTVTEQGEQQVTFEVACTFIGPVRWDTIPLPEGFEPTLPTDGRTIWGTSPSDLFVIGNDGGSSGRAAILHYDGRDWTEQAGFPGAQLRGIAGASPSDVFVIGRVPADDYRALLLHYDGIAWSEMAGPATDSYSIRYSDIWQAASGEAFLLGSIDRQSPPFTELLARYDGVTWSEVGAPGLGRSMRMEGVSATSPEDAWAIGWQWGCDVCTGINSFVSHWDGDEWSIVHTLPWSYYVAILALAPNDVWVVGTDENTTSAYVAHWDGATWTDGWPIPEDEYLPPLNGVWGRSSTDVYAVGTDVLLRYDGTRWHEIPGLGGSHIWGTPENDIFILGKDHVIHGRP